MSEPRLSSAGALLLAAAALEDCGRRPWSASDAVSAALRAHGRQLGYAGTTADHNALRVSLCSMTSRQGLLARVSRGLYQLTRRGRAATARVRAGGPVTVRGEGLADQPCCPSCGQRMPWPAE